MYERRDAAVPLGERQPAPGVPTDILQTEGSLVVVEHQPQQSFTLSGAVNVQLRADDRLRMDAVISTEVWGPEGNDRRELWRAEDDAGVDGGPANTAKTMGAAMERQWAEAAAAFDQRRYLG